MEKDESIMQYASEEVINLSISLFPSKLDHNYQKHILESIRSKYEHTCIQKYGYVLKVIKIKRICSHSIASLVPNATFNVDTCMLTFFPKIGMDFKITIDLIVSHGIFIQRNKIRIIIPLVSMEGWKLQKEFSGQQLVHSGSSSRLVKGDMVNIVLAEIRFDKDGFSCIGNLIMPTA
jgi:DNA-directed RNA polymerase subunit E'/Rpb7